MNESTQQKLHSNVYRKKYKHKEKNRNLSMDANNTYLSIQATCVVCSKY